jgi:TolA-binding protein
MIPSSKAARERIAVACALLISLGAVAEADEPTTQQRIALAAKPSVVKVVGAYVATFEVNGQRGTISIGGTGTGWFFTADGYIATNAHVVSDIQDGDDKAKRKLELQLLKTIDKDTNGKLSRMSSRELDQFTARIKTLEQKRFAYVVLPNGDKLDYEIKQYGKPGTGNDCAIIKVKIENAPTLSIGDSRKSQVQDQVVVIGYPGAADLKTLFDDKSLLQPTITDGAISALKNASSGEQILQISAAIGHGNSGGPAIDQRGNVVGLATFATDVQGFNFLVASATLVELIKAERIEPTASETTKAWDAGLDHYWANEYSEAIKDFEEVQVLFPQHSEAATMLVSAARAKKDGKEKPSSNGGAVVGLTFGGLLLGALVVVARRRKGARQHPVQPTMPMPMMYGRVTPRAPSSPLAKTFAIVPAQPAQQQSGRIAPTAFGSLCIGSVSCVRGPLQGQRFALMATGIVVGREPSVAHVLVGDHRASGKHVWIGMDQGRLVAIDQGTTNGTYINDITRGRISRAELRDGDVVIVGEPDCCSLQVRLS